MAGRQVSTRPKAQPISWHRKRQSANNEAVLEDSQLSKARGVACNVHPPILFKNGKTGLIYASVRNDSCFNRSVIAEHQCGASNRQANAAMIDLGKLVERRRYPVATRARTAPC